MSTPINFFGDITFKASHNSYARDEDIVEQLTWNLDKPHNGGCRGVEFDIWRHSSPFENIHSIDEGFFTVAHDFPFLGKNLKDYLEQLVTWHNQNNKIGGPVLVTLDIKSSEGDIAEFPNEIDTYLERYFPSNLIYKPRDLYSSSNQSESICEHVIKYGWAEPEEETYFIFCLSGNEKWKSFYAEQDPRTRFCFSDLDYPDDDLNVMPPKQGNFVFFNFHIFQKNRSIWMKTIPPFAQKNLVVRTYASNSDDNFRDCQTAGVSAIATNMVSDHPWAKVSDKNPYARRKKED